MRSIQKIKAIKSLGGLILLAPIIFGPLQIIASEAKGNSTTTLPVGQVKGNSKNANTIDLEKFSELADLAALTLCYSTTRNIDYKTSAIIATTALSKMIHDRYAGKVQGMPASASNAQGLNRWIAINLLIKASIICPKRLPSSIIKEAESIKKLQTRNN